jgi:hypothetical protein
MDRGYSLYLDVIAAIYDGDQENSLYRVMMVVITFIIVAFVGRLCEK